MASTQSARDGPCTPMAVSSAGSRHSLVSSDFAADSASAASPVHASVRASTSWRMRSQTSLPVRDRALQLVRKSTRKSRGVCMGPPGSRAYQSVRRQGPPFALAGLLEAWRPWLIVRRIKMVFCKTY